MSLIKQIRVDLGKRTYPVWIQEHLLDHFENQIASCVRGKQCVVVSQKKVFGLFGKKICDSLINAGFQVHHYLVQEGEQAKSFSVAEKIIRQCAKWGLNRRSFLIALGGGVIGDLTGYVAASYMRGIDFIQIPTTLLSQVDSSVGGKVAINIPEGKNMVGFFYQPKCVIIDPLVLKTLPVREIKNGLSEIVKYALIRDTSLFKYLKRHCQSFESYEGKKWIHVIYKSVLNKASIVKEDETEIGIRAILNFGHTFGHAIEKTWGYKKYSHGEAVAMGMRMAIKFSLKKGWLSLNDYVAMNDLLLKFKLDYPYPEEKRLHVFNNLFFDKKRSDKGITFIMISKIGQVFESVCEDLQEMKKFILKEMK